MLKYLQQGPRKHGWTTELWTLPRIVQLIETKFSVHYDQSGVWRLLRRLDWSCQKPERRARERDDDAVERWRKEDWPRIKKARSSGRTVVCLDESGFMLQPTVRRTWAAHGYMPMLLVRHGHATQRQLYLGWGDVGYVTF